MAESNASIDEALKQISDTLKSDSECLQRIEQSLKLLRFSDENQLPPGQTAIRKLIKTMENNLKTLLISPNEIRLIKEDVTEIKHMVKTQLFFHVHSSTPIYRINAQRTDQTASPPNPRILQGPESSMKTLQETSRIATPLTIAIPSSSTRSTFSDTPSERSCLFPVPIGELKKKY